MKDIKIKYSLIALSYLFLIFLIIISYVSIMPEEDIPILENSGKLIKEEKNNFLNNENTVYEILEKKEKSIEDIIEKELEDGQKVNLENKFKKIQKVNSNKVQKLEINTKFEFFQGGCIASLDPVLPEFSP